jgi:membrane associated rhomboid family serine protease
MSGQLSDERAGKDFFRRKLGISMIVPGVFVFLMWLVKAVELMFDVDLTRMGIYPLSVNGLQGILFSPLIHESFGHLFNNSLPLFFLGTFLFYFYSEIAVKVSIWIYFLTGAAVWITGREAWHIGASGLIYGLASFLFFSGIIRKHFRLAGLSLLIVFLYGSMVWGIFPDVYRDVSWESHLLGFVAGIVLAVSYRKQGPQAPVYEWPEDEVSTEEDIEDGEAYKK